jgi:hypothetical protein
MPNQTSSSTLDLELMRARQLLAQGRRQEALAVALNLLQQTLGDLRHSLLALHRDLAQARDAVHKPEDAPAEGQFSRKAGGPYLH